MQETLKQMAISVYDAYDIARKNTHGWIDKIEILWTLKDMIYEDLPPRNDLK
jgi:hypothetical protein